jgi:EAL domain-containing protein (putative c-di-GMP-specific phosphodiesterase class I)
MPHGRALRFLVVVVLLNGVVCLVAPAMVVLNEKGGDAPVGDVLYLLALVALLLTPLQLIAVSLAVWPGIHDYRRIRRSTNSIDVLIRERRMAISFQPVFDLNSGAVMGAEALARFPAHDDLTPDEWFAAAERLGRGRDLELLAVTTALQGAKSLPPGLTVAVNVSPATFEDPRLMSVLEQSGLHLGRVVLELTEHVSIADYAILRRVREQLAERGVRLAVDDAGSGYASMRHIVALAPDVIKIDRSLVSGIDHDPARRALVSAVVFFALESGGLVLAEGIENADELDTLVTLGVDGAQGFFLGRPSGDPAVHGSWAFQRCVSHRGLERRLQRPQQPTLDEGRLSGGTTRELDAQASAAGLT